MKIVVLVKHVPSPVAGARLSEADEYPVEQARRIARRQRHAQITALTVGPPRAARALRRALVLGADEGVHVLVEPSCDDDPMVMSRVLAAAIRRLGFDLVLCGAGSTGAEMSPVPAMVAERLGIPVFCLADALSVGESVEVRRDGAAVRETFRVSLPAVVSVTERCGEPAYPTYGAMADARHKLLRTWPLSRLGLERADIEPVTAIVRTIPAPARAASGVLVDCEAPRAATHLVNFLAERDLL